MLSLSTLVKRLPEFNQKSRNGSFLNGKRIDTGVLTTSDEVRLGTAKMQYRVDYTVS